MGAGILLVDDSPARRSATADLLGAARHAVFLACSAAEGLAAVQEHRPDVVLLEATLGDAPCRDLPRRIKRDCGYFPPPALVMVSPRNAEVRPIDSDADDYVARPFEDGELLARIAAALRLREQQLALAEQSAQSRALTLLSEAALRSREGLGRAAAEAVASVVAGCGCAVFRWDSGALTLDALVPCPGPCRLCGGTQHYLTLAAEVAMAAGRILNSARAGGEAPLEALAAHRPAGVATTLALPLIDAEGMVGCIAACTCEHTVFSAGRADFLESVAQTLTLALRREATISENRRAAQIKEQERRLLRLIAGGTPVCDVLAELCRSLELLSEMGLTAAVALADQQSGCFRCAAAPSLPDALREAVERMRVDDPSVPCARAIASREPVILDDLPAEPADTPAGAAWRVLGIGALWSYPILVRGAPVGTLALFSRAAARPGAHERSLIDFAVEVARIGLDHGRHERALRDSEARFRDFAELAADWYWEQDADFRFTRITQDGDRQPIVARNYGAGAVGKLRWELPYIDVPEGFWEWHRAQLAAGEPFTGLPFRLRDAEGALRHVEVSGRPVFDEAGRLAGYRGVGRDVTARVDQLEALRRSEEDYRRLIQDNPLPIWLFDAGTHQLLEASAGACALVGCSRETILAGKVTDFRMPDDLGPFLERLGRSQANGGFEDAGLWRTRRADGSAITTRIGWGNVVYGGRKAKIAHLQNVSEQVRAEESIRTLNATLEERVKARTAALEAANRELDAFNYSVSHDLRTPLRSIDGFSQALLEDWGPRLDDAGRDYLGRIRAAAARMSGLIDALYNLSRLSRSLMHIRPVDLSASAELIVAELREQEAGRKVEVIVTPHAMAEADPGLMRIVLANLIGNAWKYTGKADGAQIEFGITADGDGTPAYFVADNGAGFDMAFADKLFKLFHRLHRDEEFRGHGVGLATVQRIVRRHGGRIWAQAEKGKGATFFFTLWENEAMRRVQEEASAQSFG